MNDLAIMLGYAGRTEKKTLREKREDTAVRNLGMNREHIINVLGKTAKEKRAITNTVDSFIKKYGTKIINGEYQMITSDELLAVGDGTIVDEENHVIIWTRQKYLSWDEMTSL